MSRRPDIRMTSEEQETFLANAPKASLSTVDQHGFPHVVAMGFLAKDGEIYMTSFGKAQKVVNARRNPKVGVLIETGEHYAEYRGVMIRGTCEVIDQTEKVEEVMRASLGKDTGNASRTDAISHAAKRVVLKITPEKIATWDHAKLGGKY